MQEIINSLFSDWSKGDVLSLAEVLVSVLVVLLTAIAAVWGWTVRAWLTERRLISQFGADLYLPEDIRNATRYYVRPDATNIDLAQEIEEGHHIIVVREDLFKNIDRFLLEESEHHHMILLADSGMGKSSFVLNYYDYNRRKWRGRHKLAVIPLGISAALEKIKEIPKKNETILLLDAFDEDPGARHDYKQRLDELMEACIEFRRVLITCRTQFFPTDAAIPTVASTVFTPRKGPAQHTYWRLYIAPFSDRQIDTYLRRRFNVWAIKKKREARDLAQKVPKLTVRPMLLLHIPDLLQAGKPVTSAWDIYQILVENWYEREIGFWKDKEVFRKFSEEVAVQFYIDFRKHGSDRVPRESIVKIIEQIRSSKEMTEDSLNDIDEWKATSRSLLHRDADGNWKFAHRSVMEFLFLKRFIEGDERCRGLLWTDQMKKFATEIVYNLTALPGFYKFAGADISRADLGGADLSGADLIEANLSNANLTRAYLFQANLSKAYLREINLREANLSRADLSGAYLRSANLSSANLSASNLGGADLSGADLSGADLSGAFLVRVDLSRADLSASNLSGADLNSANLSSANLSSANLGGADLGGADLSDITLGGANLRGANLSNVRYLSTQPFLQASVDLTNTILPREIEDELVTIKLKELIESGRLSAPDEELVRIKLNQLIKSGQLPAPDEDTVYWGVSFRPTDLVSVIQRVLATNAEPTRPLNDIEARLPEKLVTMVRPERIESVIENLVINALEAMGAKGGRLTVEAGRMDDDKVFFSVADTGVGMTEEFMKTRLFRPFATTKAKGIGLGLYTCREVVEAHGGRIEVESKKGEGTCFRVVLPSRLF